MIIIARQVRCQVTGEYGVASEFYKVATKKRNLYYKNKEVYLKMLQDREDRAELLEYVSVNILNYNSEEFLPPLFLRRIKELNGNYPYEVILSTFKENEETLLYWVNQDGKFKNENNRLNYMLAIIQNKINDIYLKWQVDQRRKNDDNTPNVELSMMDVEVKSVSKNNKDISDFL